MCSAETTECHSSLPENVDDYIDLGEVGRGHFGEVHKVCPKSDTSFVLVWKKLAFYCMPDNERAQVAQEVAVLKQLDHPGVVKYFGKIMDDDNRFLYILMEWCDGGDLGQHLRESISTCADDPKESPSIPEAVLVEWLRQLLETLDYCYSRREGKVLHRDIKPQNILLSQGRVKLADFGLAKMMNAENLAETHVGTPYYMSPELLRKEVYDEKSDVWALGCVFFELVSGRSPFFAAKTTAGLRRMVDGPAPALSDNVSPELKTLISKMMSPSPTDRPAPRELLGNLLMRYASCLHYQSLYEDAMKEIERLKAAIPETNDSPIQKPEDPPEIRTPIRTPVPEITPATSRRKSRRRSSETIWSERVDSTPFRTALCGTPQWREKADRLDVRLLTPNRFRRKELRRSTESPMTQNSPVAFRKENLPPDLPTGKRKRPVTAQVRTPCRPSSSPPHRKEDLHGCRWKWLK